LPNIVKNQQAPVRNVGLIVDRIDISVLKMVEKYAEQGQVAFLIRKRVGGQVVLPEAIRKLKVSVS
jgi:HK97 family phage major capsid protein